MKTIVKKSAGIIPGMIFFLAMVPTVIVHKIVVVAKLPRSVDNLIIKVYAILKAMTDNAWFPDASSLLAELKMKNDKLLAAQNLAKTRELGKVKFRDTAKYDVLNVVSELIAHVQSICIHNPDLAVSIAESALFHARGRGGMPKQKFSVKNIASGRVQLRGSVTYPCYAHYWIMSNNPLNKASWYITIIPSTTKAKTIVTGLVPGERVYFRHRFLSNHGLSDWEQMISIIVT